MKLGHHLLCVLTLSLQFLALNVSGQGETKPVQIRSRITGQVEEYNVLQSDKSVRQGQYVRYWPASPFRGLAILEVGNYNNGLKEGEWRTFSHNKPWNKLESKGFYHAGLPDGMWIHYQLFTPANTVAAQVAATDVSSKTGYSVNVNNTSAVLQAQGPCALGARVGVWVYYNHKGQVLQRVNHFTNQLLYIDSELTPSSSGCTITNHSVLYVGGKEQLKAEIFRGLEPYMASISTTSSVGKISVTEFVFMVDALGKQTGVTLVNNATLSRHEKVLLKSLAAVPVQWLPKMTDGKPQLGEYRVKFTTEFKEKGVMRGVEMKVEPLGD